MVPPRARACRYALTPAPASFVASEVDVDEPRLGVIADAASLADDPFADVVQLSGRETAAIDVRGQAVDVGGVGDAADLPIIVGRPVARGDRDRPPARSADIFQRSDESWRDPDVYVCMFSGPELGKMEILGELGVWKRPDERCRRQRVHGIVFGAGVMNDIGAPSTGVARSRLTRADSIVGTGIACDGGAEVDLFALFVPGHDQAQSAANLVDQFQAFFVDGYRLSPVLGRTDKSPFVLKSVVHKDTSKIFLCIFSRGRFGFPILPLMRVIYKMGGKSYGSKKVFLGCKIWGAFRI